MRRRLLGLMTFAVALGALGLASEAEAAQVRNNPFGASTTSATIGSRIGLGAGVLWRRVSDNMCGWTTLGPGAMDDDYFVRGGSGNTTINVATQVTNINCLNLSPGGGNNIITVGVISSGGHFLDIETEGGVDFAMNAAFLDTFMHGGDGNDILNNFRPDAVLNGGNGDDKIISQSSGSGEHLIGEGGVDCLEDTNASSATFDCGPEPGEKKASGRFPPAISGSCENIVSSC